MKTEYASRQSRTGVLVPTPAEFAAAARQGKTTITGDELRAMRAAARTAAKVTAKPALPTPKPTAAAPAPADSLEVRKLKRKVERLQNEVARLKLTVLTGK